MPSWSEHISFSLWQHKKLVRSCSYLFLLPGLGEGCLMNICFNTQTDSQTQMKRDKDSLVQYLFLLFIFKLFKADDKDCRGPKEMDKTLSTANHGTAIPCWPYPGTKHCWMISGHGKKGAMCVWNTGFQICRNMLRIFKTWLLAQLMSDFCLLHRQLSFLSM